MSISFWDEFEYKRRDKKIRKKTINVMKKEERNRKKKMQK